MSSTNRLRLETLETREVPADLAYAYSLIGLPATAVTHVVADAVGEVYVAGTFSGTIDLNPSASTAYNLTARGGTDVFVAKYNASGKFMWGETLDGLGDESVARIALDGMGNVYVAGTFTGAVDFSPDPNASAVASAASGGSAFVWKLDYQGNFVMARTVDGTSAATGLAVDSAGNILVSGTFQGAADFNPDPNVTADLTATTPGGSAFAWKLDQTGALVWADSFQSTNSIQPFAVALDGMGNAYLSGTFTGTADFDPSDTGKAMVAAGSYSTPYVVKLTSTGAYLWSETIRTVTAVPGTTNTIAGIGIDGIGNVYAAGTFAGTLDFDPSSGTKNLTSANNSEDAFAWKLDPGGNLLYAEQFGGTNAETLTDMSIDKAGDLYATGTFTGIVDFNPAIGVANLGSGTGAADSYVEKLDANGNLIYTRSIGGGSSTTRASGILADAAGNIYLTGAFSGKADFEPANAIYAMNGGNGAGFVIKLSPSVLDAKKPNNLPPTGVSAGGPYVFLEGNGLSVKATATDPDGQPLTFSWDLNGDGIFGDAVGAKVVLNPLQMGALGLGDGTSIPRTIQVRVSDGVNLPVIVSATMTIMDVPPTIKLIAPATGVEGVRPQLSFNVLSDPSSKDVKAGFRASWDFNDDGTWDLGDGSTYAGSIVGAVKIPMNIVADSGPLQVRVRVFDKDGAFTEATTTIVIAEKAPTATFALVGAAIAGNPTTFQFTKPIDGPADTAAGFTYSFDLDGDGVYELNGASPTASTVFAQAGTYSVKGKITDQDGTFTEYTLTVNVL
jgi:hypothetical protein